MFAPIRRGWLIVPAMLLCCSVSLAQSEKETPAEKIRKVLDQPITLNFAAQDLNEVASHLKDKTGVNFTVDPNAMSPIGIQAFPPFAPNPQPQPGNVEIKSTGVKLQTALRRFLNTQKLTFVVLENSVLITTEERAVAQQLGQRINVNVADVSLAKALKEINRSTPVNLLIDPRVAKDAQNAVTLNLEGITVETAIRLLAEIGSLKMVRVDNVLFITSPATAEKMLKEQPPAAQPSHNNTFPGLFGRGMMGGIRVAPAPVPIAPAPPPVKKPE